MITMQKRGLQASVFSFGLAMLFALPSVAAQAAGGSPFGSISNMIQRVAGPILFSWGTPSFPFWGGILLWILIFALLYAILELIPPLQGKKSLKITVSAILALISVIPLVARGAPVIKALFETYGIIISTILIFAPIVGMLYLTHRVIQGRSRLVYGVRAVLFYILAAVIQNVLGAIHAQAFAASAALGEAGNFAVGVCGLLFLYNVIMFLIGGPDDTPHQQMAEGAGGLWDWLRDAVTPATPPNVPPGTPYPDHLVAHIDQLCQLITQFHHLVMPHNGYRGLGNRLLQTEYDAIVNGNAAAWANVPLHRQEFLNAAANANGMRMAIEQSIDNLLNDPQFANLRRAHHRRWQHCMRQWTVAYLTYEHYNVRFLINYTHVTGPVLPL